MGKTLLADDAPYIYGLEVSNSQGPDPMLAGSSFKQYSQELSEDNNDALENTPYDVPIINYTPTQYMQIGAKICDTLFEIYQRMFKII